MSRKAWIAVAVVIGLTFMVALAVTHDGRTPERPDPQTPPHTVATNTPVMNDVTEDIWVRATATAQGIDFEYPSTLRDKYAGKYLSIEPWPPLVEMVENDYVCFVGPVTAADGPLKTSEHVIVDGKEYCRTTSSEGAAGSIYTDYEYSTASGGSALRVVFTVRKVQCVNYDNPDRSLCETAQTDFNPDRMAARIAESVRRR